MPTRRVAVLFGPEPMALRRRETLRAFHRHAGMSPIAWRRQAERRRKGSADADE